MGGPLFVWALGFKVKDRGGVGWACFVLGMYT